MDRHLIIRSAESDLAAAESRIAALLADIQVTVTSWTPTTVSSGAAMNMTTRISELAALTARAAAQQEAVTLLKAMPQI